MQKLAPGDVHYIYAALGLLISIAVVYLINNHVVPRMENGNIRNTGSAIIATVPLLSLLWLIANIGTFTANFLYILAYTFRLGLYVWDAITMIRMRDQQEI
jgi:hypothetical protein